MILTISCGLLALIFTVAGGIAFYIKHKKKNRVNPEDPDEVYELSEALEFKNEIPASKLGINDVYRSDHLTYVNV